MKPLPAKPAAEGVAHPLVVPHAALAPDPNQPRQSGVAQGLDKLVESVRVHGVIQPILVRPHPDPAARARTPYMIVVGERRWTAAGRAGRDEVPVFLLDRPLSPAELLMLQIEENDGENRQELTLCDLVAAVARAVELEGLSQSEFALRHGKSGAWVSYRIALHRASGPVAEALRENRLRGLLAARTFQRLTPEQQQELLARARKDGTGISLVAIEKLAGRAERPLRGAAKAARDEAATAPPTTAGAAAPAPAAPNATLAAPASPPPSLTSSAAPVEPEDLASSHDAPAILAFPGPVALPGPPAAVSPARPAPTPAAPGKTAPRGTAAAAFATAAVESTSLASTALGSTAHGSIASELTAFEPAALEPTAPATGEVPTAAAVTPSRGTPAAASAPAAAPEPLGDAPPETVPPGGTSSGAPPPAVLRYRGAATPFREAAPLPGAASRAAILERSEPSGPAPVPPGPTVAALPPAAPRSAAAGLLAAAGPLRRDPHAANDPSGPLALDHPPAATDFAAVRITVELSLAQLQKLVRLLGLEPAATPRALVHQLMTSL
jgi:ParB family transcriptional regulator, chromosome partitioning protein